MVPLMQSGGRHNHNTDAIWGKARITTTTTIPMAISTPTNSPKLHQYTKKRSFSFSSSSSSSSSSSHSAPKRFLLALVTFLALLQIQTITHTLINTHLKPPLSSSWPLALSLLPAAASSDNAFLPLKDLRFSDTPMDGNTWFMSSINDTFEPGEAEHLHFPSDASGGRLLCLAGRSASNGTRNSYTQVLPHGGTLPSGMRLLRGLTFVSDTYYNYENPWHGLSAVVPFAAWHARKGCVRPARWVLYHRGELRTEMGPWVQNVAEAVFGTTAMQMETFEGGQPSCFEEAVVFRHNQGSMGKDRNRRVYDMLRCKARAYCNVSREAEKESNKLEKVVIRVTLLLRVGARSFEDEKGVIRVFERECKKVEGCRLTVARSNNLTFCDQVKLMSETDVLASPHGGQLTNMFFMDRNSSVMEFFPTGWLKLAGPGQHVFQWVASYSGMQHRGAWHDPNGDRCPYANATAARCMSFHKNNRIGHNESFLANWTSTVLREELRRMAAVDHAKLKSSQGPCQCG